MQRLRIDFFHRQPTFSVSSWLLLLVGIMSMAVSLLDYSQAHEELKSTLEMNERKSRIKMTRVRTVVHPTSPELAKASERANAALAQPWERVLSALESQTYAEVALIGVEMQGPARSIRIAGEAKSMEDVVGYVERLQSSPSIVSIELGSHEVRTVQGVRVIRFSADLVWGEKS